MPNVSGAIFVAKHLTPSDVLGKRVLDVGSCDYNGSVAPLIKHWQPREYIGVDIVAGKGVDVVCSGEELTSTFGAASFDVVLCIEVIEHARNWQKVVSNLKSVLKPGGVLVVTTRSQGYAIHGFPNDFWRFECEDFQTIFADCEDSIIESDPTEPGVFIKTRKPLPFQELDLSEVPLYCVLTNKRCKQLPQDLTTHSFYWKVRLKQFMRNSAYALLLGCGRVVSKLFGIK